MCFIGTGSLVRLCLCKLQWYSDCVLPSAGVPQATLGVLQAHFLYNGTGKCDFDKIKILFLCTSPSLCLINAGFISL
jgi:hypothetical protein